IASAVAGETAYAMAAPPRAEIEQAPLDVTLVPEPIAVGAEAASAPRATEPPPPPPHRGAVAGDTVVDEVRRAVTTANDARSLGRVLRDAMSVITDASAFSVALFHATRPEVAYRYKVVGPDRDSAELGRQHVDDGPACYAARHDRRWHVF